MKLPALALLIAALTLSSLALADAPAPDEEIARLRALMEDGDCERALAGAAAALERHPDQPDLLAIEGNCLVAGATSSAQVYDAQRYEELRLAVGLDQVPARFKPALYRNELRFDETKLEEGLERFRRALAADPDRADLLVGMVAALANAGRIDDALATLDVSSQTVEKAQVVELSQIVRDLLGRGRLDDAARLAYGLVKRYPRSPEPLIEGALVALARLEARPAMAGLAAAAELSPKNFGVQSQLARLLMMAREYERAVSPLVPLANERLEAMAWLAVARSRASTRSAERIWTDVAARMESSSTKPRGVQMLLEHHQRILSSDAAPTANMRLRAAEMFESRGLALGAIAEADAALEADASLTEAWLLIARIQRAVGFLDLALEALDSAQSVGPDAPEIAASRVRVLLGLRRYEKVLESTEQAAGAALEYEAGLAALALGREELARERFARAAEAGGTSAPRARARLAELESRAEDQE